MRSCHVDLGPLTSTLICKLPVTQATFSSILGCLGVCEIDRLNGPTNFDYMLSVITMTGQRRDIRTLMPWLHVK